MIAITSMYLVNQCHQGQKQSYQEQPQVCSEVRLHQVQRPQGHFLCQLSQPWFGVWKKLNLQTLTAFEQLNNSHGNKYVV